MCARERARSMSARALAYVCLRAHNLLVSVLFTRIRMYLFASEENLHCLFGLFFVLYCMNLLSRAGTVS